MFNFFHYHIFTLPSSRSHKPTLSLWWLFNFLSPGESTLQPAPPEELQTRLKEKVTRVWVKSKCKGQMAKKSPASQSHPPRKGEKQLEPRSEQFIVEAFKALILYPSGEMGSILRQREGLWILYNLCIREPVSAWIDCILWVSKPLLGLWLEIVNFFSGANFLRQQSYP